MDVIMDAERATSYMEEFCEKTNDGGLFTHDISTLVLRNARVRTKLTSKEKEERRAWEMTRPGLRKHYKLPVLNIATQEALLRFRVAPPLLKTQGVSSRSKAVSPRSRRYALSTEVWTDFERSVDAYVPLEEEKNTEQEKEYRDPLYRSLDSGSGCTDESDEKYFITAQVLDVLSDAGLLKHKKTSEAPQPVGKPDHLLEGKVRDKDVLMIPIEFKSTHNLLLPIAASGIVERYNSAVQEMTRKKTKERTTDWSNIAHPLGQIISYMCMNHSCYGVLSSGTRSYFLKVHEPNVLISDAWLVGKKNYLRAWAYFYNIAKDSDWWTPPDDWLGKTPTGSPSIDDVKKKGRKNERNDDADNGDDDDEDKGDDDDDDEDKGDDDTEKPSKKQATSEDRRKQAGASCSPHAENCLLTSAIPWTDSKNIEFTGFLGQGNNAVHRANWLGQQVAVKSFDMFKDYKYFEREVRAYEHLKDAWGVLIPKPYFISEYCGAVALLGIQLGRDPNSSDQGCGHERDLVFDKLLSDYGFHHLDTDSGNVIYIKDDNGKERLVAIDLESHEIRGKR